jgi:uncharacterized membrane protein YwzB
MEEQKTGTKRRLRKTTVDATATSEALVEKTKNPPIKEIPATKKLCTPMLRSKQERKKYVPDPKVCLRPTSAAFSTWPLGENYNFGEDDLYFGVMRGGKELKTLVIGSLHKEIYQEEVFPEQAAPLKGKPIVVDCERTVWKPIQYRVDSWTALFRAPSAYQGNENSVNMQVTFVDLDELRDDNYLHLHSFFHHLAVKVASWWTQHPVNYQEFFKNPKLVPPCNVNSIMKYFVNPLKADYVVYQKKILRVKVPASPQPTFFDMNEGLPEKSNIHPTSLENKMIKFVNRITYVFVKLPKDGEDLQWSFSNALMTLAFRDMSQDEYQSFNVEATSTRN